MKRKLWMAHGAALCLGLALASAAPAQTPSDTCAGVGPSNAIPPAGGIVTGNLTSTIENVAGLCSGSTGGSDVFFGYTPTISGTARFSLCASTPAFDSIISVYSSCALGAATMLGCNDDGCGAFAGRSILDVAVTGGVQHFVRVAHYEFSSTAAFSLAVTAPVAPPGNDVCGANTATFTIPPTGGTVTGTNAGATTDGITTVGLTGCLMNANWTSGRDVYHYFTPAVISGSWTITACTGTNFDTILSIHSGCPATAANQLACNDDGCGFAGPSSITTGLTDGVLHVIRVAGWRPSSTSTNLGNTGTYTLNVTGEVLGVCCSPSTGSCSLVSAANCPAPNVFDANNGSCNPNPCVAGTYDDCATPVTLTPGVAVDGSTVSTFGTALAACDPDTTQDVWFSFTPAAAGSFRATCDPVSGDFLSLTAYVGGCPATASSGIACAFADNPSVVVFNLGAGENVLLRVGDLTGSPGISFSMLLEAVTTTACCSPGGICSLVVSPGACPGGTTASGAVCRPTSPCTPVVAPPNDDCATAVAGPAFNVPPAGGSVTGTALGATTDGAGCGAAAPGTDVYHGFTPTTAGYYEVSLCTSATDWDSVVSVHTGCPASAANLVDPDACEDFGCTGDQAQIDFVLLAAGTPVVIRVATFDATIDGAAYTLAVTPVNAGACCGISGNCFVAAQADCTSPGVYQGNGSTCASAPCPPTGSCCLASSSLCFSTTQAFCVTTMAGTWTEAQSCTPNPCPTGAVPANDPCGNAVALTTFPTNLVQGSDLATNDGPIAAQGSCNYSGTNEGIDNSIWYSFSPTQNGTFGITVSPFGTYDSIVVVYSGATCATMTEVACTETPEPIVVSVPVVAGTVYRIAVGDWGTVDGGGWNALAFTFTPSVPVSDNCCRGTTCNPVTAGTCMGVFAGSNSQVVATCGTGTSFATCCFADFSHSGGTTIDDLFLYLNAYFTGSPWANVGGNGVDGPTIDDLFLYINAYFNGCTL